MMITATDLLVIVNMTALAGKKVDADTPSSQYGVLDNDTQEATKPPTLNSSQSPLTELSFYLNGISTMAVIALGIVGNTLSMVVLTRRTMRTSTNVFLTALAIWDTVVLVVCLLLICLFELSMPFREQVFPYIVVYVYPVALAAQTATVWLTVSFTVERYIAVCHPLRAASMCTIPRARLVVMVISVVSILYNIPRWLEYSIMTNSDLYNQTFIYPGTTPLGRHSIYHKIYYGWLYFLVMCFIPLCSLAILNSFLIVAVRRSQRQRKDMNVRQSRENNVTIMLVSVVMVFIICQVPALIYNMAYSIDMPKVMDTLGWIILSHIRNFLVTLNSAINFILYCALGQKFRRTFVRTLCPCLMRRMPGRFQSFSFNHNRDSVHYKSTPNGNLYTNVSYKQCRTDIHKDTSLDMKILRSKHSPRESTDSNGSGEAVDTYHSNMSQRSNVKLLTPIYKGVKTI